MEPQPGDPDRPPYPLIFPSDWASFWDLGYLLAEARRRSDMFGASDLSDD